MPLRTTGPAVAPLPGTKGTAHQRLVEVFRKGPKLHARVMSTYTTTVGSQTVELPLVPLSDELTIALLICVDLGVVFVETAGRELAQLMRPERPEIVVSVATMGIPLAIEASRALGLDDYVILHKTPEIHLGETWSEPVNSITTEQATAAAHRTRPGWAPCAAGG